MNASVEVISRKKIDSRLLAEIDRYTQLEFGHIPIVQKFKWAEPDWSVVALSGGRVVSFLNIVERKAVFDQESVRLGGINNVITPLEYRKCGYATTTMTKAQEFMMNELRVDCGLLLCATDLVPFYERLGWRQALCPLFFDQSDGKIEWTQHVLIYPGSKTPLNISHIDLCGYPW